MLHTTLVITLFYIQTDPSKFILVFNECSHHSRLSLLGYHNLISRFREDGPKGGVGVCFIKETPNYIIREAISVFIPHRFESVFIEIVNKTERNIIVVVIYRPNTEP